jgi:hypothetical protein
MHWTQSTRVETMRRGLALTHLGQPQTCQWCAHGPGHDLFRKWQPHLQCRLRLVRNPPALTTPRTGYVEARTENMFDS